MATEYPKKSAAAARTVAQQAVDAAADRMNAALQAQTEQLVERLVEKTAKKAEAKVATAAKKVDKAAEKVKASLSAAHTHVHRVEDPIEVWTRHAVEARRPRFTRDDIAAAAIRIADTEGIESVSMRRLAAELDVGTMTLYHYIATKDELLTLVFDGMMREIALPAGTSLPSRWRDAVTLIARRSRDALRRHPWVLDISDDPPLGPNAVRHFDQSLQALASLDVPLATKIDILTTVDEYVFGFCLQERNNQGDGLADLTPEMKGYLYALIDTGEYPALSELVRHTPMNTVWLQVAGAMRDGGRFDRNLGRILDGFERELATRPGKR